MDGHRRDEGVVVGGNARQRLYDARGFGRPLAGGELALAPVEAAYLLVAGDLDAVDGAGFPAFLAEEGPDLAVRFLVYADLRSRGFYVSAATDGSDDATGPAPAFTVYERGHGPPDGDVAFELRVLGERTSLPAASLGSTALAIVDEEGDVSYYETGRPSPTGSSAFDPPAARGAVLADRVAVWDPPAGLFEHGFYGQPLAGEDGSLQLSLVEAAYLARRGALTVSADGDRPLVERGRAVEGERFDRRLAVYSALRDRGLVPKTGYKFGADFRTYEAVDTVDDLPHSRDLVRVLPADYTFEPRELSLDVRLAGGVRKRMVFALVGDGEIDWVSVERLTP